MTRRTHIPYDGKRTLCGRPLATSTCIALNQCIDDATCISCQRVDDRQQAASYRYERTELMFVAALRWAARMGADELYYHPFKQRAIACFGGMRERYANVEVRFREDLEMDAEDLRHAGVP